MGKLLTNLILRHLSKGTFWITLVVSYLVKHGIPDSYLAANPIATLYDAIPWLAYILAVNVEQGLKGFGQGSQFQSLSDPVNALLKEATSPPK